MDDDKFLEAAVESLVLALAPAEPRPSIKNRLMARVAAYEQLRPLADIRRYEGGWVSSGFEGINIRPLFHDRESGRRTYLLRMDAGARLPSHSHGDDEQCLVLEGDVRWGHIAYEAGDFVVMGKATKHPEIHSESGNLLLLIAGHNEFEKAESIG